MKEIEINHIYNEDCLETMKRMADKSVDLVLTDPPYGIFKPMGENGAMGNFSGMGVDASKWDIKPTQEFFDEVKRVGKNYVIWGGNYFADMIGACKEPWIWDKQTGKNFFADGELAFTSYQGTLRIYHHQWCGAFKASERGEKAMHPTQKPVALMAWCMRNTKEGDLIYDPMCGSGSTLIAAKMLKRNYIGCEISPEYCKIAQDRIKSISNPLF